MANDKLKAVSSHDLYAVCVTLECAHEYDDLEAARGYLVRWGVTQDEAITELLERNVVK